MALITIVGILSIVVVSGVTSAGNSNPACYSTTDQYIIKSLVVATQPLASTLIQRYQGNQLKIYCMSFEEYGPSCGSASVPQLCYRQVADASAAFACETLTDYVSNVDAEITRGTLDGPEMIWLVKWDGTSKSVSCYPRQVDIRMLAFVYNNVESNKTVFGVLLVLAILSVLLILVALFAYIRTRWYQIDYSGATTIAGPKTVFRGPQMAVNPPLGAKDLTTVYLPVRESAALNEMTTSRVSQLLADPHTPRGKSIYLDDEEGGRSLNRGPGSSIRRRKASPPAPGDGVHDPALVQRMSEARRMRSRYQHGKRSDGGILDDDEFDEEDRFQRRSLRGLQDDDDNDMDYGAGGGAGGRYSARRGASKQRPRQGVLFPTQPNLSVAGAEDSDGFFQQYGNQGLDAQSYVNQGLSYEDGGSGKPEMAPPTGNLRGNQPSIRYVPQWMQGSFGRGGVIPEAGDAPEDFAADDYENQPSGRTVRLDTAPGTAPASASKRYYAPPVDQPPIDQENMVGGMGSKSTPRGRQNTPQTRSALKKRGGNQLYESGAESDDALRRGVSFHGDYVGRGDVGSNLSGGRAFGGDDGAQNQRRGQGFGQNRTGGGRQQDGQDNFSRGKAKIHNRSLQLEAQDEQTSVSANNNHDSGSAHGGERVSVVGTDEQGNPIYSTRSVLGSSGVSGVRGKNNDGAYECDDCHERVNPGSNPVFCAATGLRHF